MTTTAPPRGRPPVERATVRRAVLWPRLADTAVMLGFVLAAFLIYRPLWLNLSDGYLFFSGQDQNLWEWFFAVTAHKVLNFENPLTTTLQNHPDGVNLAANTAMFGLGVPLTPITVLFGPTVTFALALTGGMAGTAVAWYWVLSRHVVDSRAGAAVGAAFCGFAPPIVSHGNAHPNFVALFLLPFVVLCLLTVVRGARPVRGGVFLGLLVAWQLLLGKEPLLIAAVTMTVFALSYALMRPAHALALARPLGVALGTGAAVALVLVAVPLWWQFFGPQSYPGLEHGLRGNDLAAFPAFATESLAGTPDSAVPLSMNRTEENAFFGWPLLLVLAGVVAALWRVASARALAVTALVLAWISMGAVLYLDGTPTAIPGIWLLLFDRPLFDSVLESRFALGALVPVGILLAMATERVLRMRTRPDRRYAATIVWVSALAFALVPIAPTELRVTERGEAPAFFADGTWRTHVHDGSVVPVPPPDVGDADPLHWQMAAGMGFPLVEGYFVGPNRDGEGRYGAPRRPTSILLERVAEDGGTPEITVGDRAAARRDLQHWNADLVVLPIGTEHQHELRATVSALLDAPGRAVGDVWLWDVDALLER
ncbi:hypothetical protein [Saccharomonospora halophila]|uniref:hypothetical protein n=1 Tax=Saccharomonospora halophila TaxID=129922 RepID=UPI000377985A